MTFYKIIFYDIIKEMSKRSQKKSVEIVEPVEDVELVENEDEQSVENEEVISTLKMTEIPLRICVSCGSSANLFKNKTHKRCIECLNLLPKKTEKQLESFKKAREIRQANILRRKQEIQELEKQAKEELDKKIVSKAISIKKKLIKQNAELDAVSDDDSPLEEVIKIAKKKPAQKKVVKQISKQVVSEEIEQTEPQYQPQIQQIPQVRTFKFL